MSSLIIKIAVRIPIFLISVLSGAFLYTHSGWSPIACFITGLGIFIVLNVLMVLFKFVRIVLCIFSAGCIGILVSSSLTPFLFSKIALPDANWTVYANDACFFVIAIGITIGLSFLFHYFVDFEYSL